MNNFLSFIKILPLLFFILSSGSSARTLSFSGPKDYARLIEGLSSTELAKLKAGFSLFAKPWVAAPSSTRVRDGLGPHFNATSCMSCHSRMGRGNPFGENQTVGHSILFRVSIGNSIFSGPLADPNYGLQLQVNSIGNIPRESKSKVKFSYIKGSFKDGEEYELREPEFYFENLNYGSLPSARSISPRTSPHLAGLGYIDSISEQEILLFEDEADQNGDGISGRANYSWSPSRKKLMLGKFGHKANVPTLLDQIAGAFQGDIGITSSYLSNENCSAFQDECLAQMNGGSPEISDKHLGFVHLLLTSIEAPRVQQIKNASKGQKIFQEIGCSKCHRAGYMVNGQMVSPYSDFLLHDMGESLSDNREDFIASGREWKTAPLWGLGSLRKVNGHSNLLHDGRARSISEAILWHGGEGESSKQKFLNLPKQSRKALIFFLNSL